MNTVHTCNDHQTPEDAATEQHLSEASPEFLEAVSMCFLLQETLGIDHPEADRALSVAMRLAPQSLHDEMHQKARDMGLVPEPSGYTEDGQPAYSLECIAAKMGVPMAEAEDRMREMLEMHNELGLPTGLLDPATVHRVQ